MTIQDRLVSACYRGPGFDHLELGSSQNRSASSVGCEQAIGLSHRPPNEQIGKSI